MKAIDPDYEAPENEFTQYPNGKYKVNSFDWTSLDASSKRPILVAQKDGKLVGRLKFNLIDGKEGPPMSMTLGEMSLFAKAFGVELNKLSNVPAENQPGLITQYMEDVKKLVSEKCAAGKVVEVEVKGGWVNNDGVPGMSVPPGFFYFHLVDITSPTKDSSGDIAPHPGKFGSFFFVTFEVDSGEGGSPTPYKSAQFTELVNYAVQVENGVADFERGQPKDGQPGAYTGSAVRLSKLMRLTAPELFVDDFIPPNPNNLLPYWKRFAVANKRLLKGSRVKEEKGPRINLVWNTVEEVAGQPARVIETMNIDDKVRQVLVEALDNLAKGKSTVNGTFELSDAGKGVAKQWMSPLKKSGQIQHGSLEELTVEEIQIIMNHLTENAGLDQSYKERVIMLGVGFEPPAQPYEEDDSPF